MAALILYVYCFGWVAKLEMPHILHVNKSIHYRVEVASITYLPISVHCQETSKTFFIGATLPNVSILNNRESFLLKNEHGIELSKKIKLRKDQKLNEFILLSNILTTWSLSFKDGINFFSFP